LPTFHAFYDAFGADLPAPTRALMGISAFLGSYSGIVLAVVGVLYVFRHRLRLPALSADFLGAVFPGYRMFRVSAFSSRLAQWIAGCGAEPEVLRAALRYLAADDGSMRACALELESRLGAGRPLAEALEGLAPLPRFLAIQARFAARLDDPAPANAQLVELADVRAALYLDRFARRLTVASYVAIGITLGGTIVALYLPMFKLASVI
jgi:type IV pilus assembly protein PilC